MITVQPPSSNLFLRDRLPSKDGVIKQPKLQQCCHNVAARLPNTAPSSNTTESDFFLLIDIWLIILPIKADLPLVWKKMIYVKGYEGKVIEFYCLQIVTTL